MDTLLHDLRYAFRQLARAPSFTAVAVLTLALGIGAATAIFGIVDSAMLRPLPFAEPDRLAMLWGVAGPERDVRFASYAEIRDWEAMTRSFSDVSIYDGTTRNLRLVDGDGAGEAEVLPAEVVSPGYFALLGVAPALGRGFRPDDDRPGAAPAVVISHGLWRRRFGGADDAIGRAVVVDDRDATIVGVMPEGFAGLSFDAEVWTTLLPFGPPELENLRSSRWLAAIGRLAPGVTPAAAEADLRSAALRLEEMRPDANRERSVDLVSMQRFYLEATRTSLLVVLGAVGLLLLIACVNVTNLEIMRGIGRRGEVALRFALGAGRARLVRQVVIEAVLLALHGGIAGVALAWLGMEALLALVPAGVLPGYVAPSIDARVLAFAAGSIALCAALAGIVPGLRATRRGLSDDLRAPDRGAAPARAGTAALQRALVTLEVALAVALMGVAALMVRSLAEQLDVPPGFDAENVLVAGASLSEQRYAAEERSAFVRALLEDLDGVAGIDAVAVGSDAPLRGRFSAAMMVPEGRTEQIRYYRHFVTPSWFATLGIPVLRGRGVAPSDDAGAPVVAVVSESFARKAWPGLDPLGRSLQIGRDAARGRATVVGVAADVRYRDLTTDLMDPGEDPDVYLPYAQFPAPTFEIAVRSATSEPPSADAVRAAVAALDPAVPLAAVDALAAALAAQTAGARSASAIIGAFAVLALALSAIGLYGVVAFLVASRRREIAIRIAMGAERGRVLRMVIRQGMVLVAVGAAAGLVAVLLGGRLLESVLFGVVAYDPAVYVSVIALVATALVASAVPAWRAARIEPTEALRHE